MIVLCCVVQMSVLYVFAPVQSSALVHQIMPNSVFGLLACIIYPNTGIDLLPLNVVAVVVGSHSCTVEK